MKTLGALIYFILLCMFLSFSCLLLAQGQNNSVLTVHVVQRGENLFRIALQYDLFANEVAKANGITDNDSIVVGQRLIIPLLQDLPDEPLRHTVLAGETIHSIATAYGKTANELLSLNGLAEDAEVYVGQRLVIVPGELEADPKPTSVQSVAEETSPSSPQPISAGATNQSRLILGDPDFAFFHTVEAGDTVFDIGMRFNLAVSDIAKENNLQDPTKIFIGQRLVIPGIEPPRLAHDLPDIVASFTIDPLILQEGRTGRFKVHTTVPVEVSGMFLGQELRIIANEDNTRHNVMVGIPMFTEQGVYPLQLNLVDQEATSVAIAANLQIIAGGYGYQTISINNSELLSPAVENEERALMVRATSPFTEEKYWNASLSLPAAATMNARFGTLRSYNGSAYDRYHHGVDFAGATGTPVLAAADGVVVLADALKIRGRTTIIDHGWGLYTAYAHQNSIQVSPGEQVTSGQIIGAIGSTGRSTGPHLHWEVWLNGVNVDPLQWVQQVFP
ncbi:MAG: LysM peptidoglycan-binding domain-containing protein [Chloroflexota bacterium]|nr:LysM peptidoglycan-binding domain-containing protein [Chloroflexota bacterium]MDE2950260.1 LysM peptidoglycan-binding domain-containing protein [Chloroflexota bacterium]